MPANVTGEEGKFIRLDLPKRIGCNLIRNSRKPPFVIHLCKPTRRINYYVLRFTFYVLFCFGG